MITKEKFIEAVVRIAKERGYKIESTANTEKVQIDFGNKKLHTDHLEKLYPEILFDNANIDELIEQVAPGRPCSHKPMREIIEQLKKEQASKQIG